MRLITVMVLLAAASTGLMAQDQSALSAGLFPLVGVHSRVWADHADTAAYPSQDPAFAAGGVTEAFDAFFRGQIAAAGCNALAVDVSLPCDVETTANRLANLCAWADGFEGGKPQVIVSLSGLHKAESVGDAVTAAVAVVGRLAASLGAETGGGSTPYQRIAAYRVAPELNVLQAAKGGTAQEAALLLSILRGAIHATERDAFGTAFPNTPIVADFSMDYALLTRGRSAAAGLGAEDIDAAHAELRGFFDAVVSGEAADILGITWLPGSLAAGSSDDVVGLLARLAADYPEATILLSRTGASTAFDTQEAQADYCLGLLAGLAAQTSSLPGLMGLCWAADVDDAAPEPPDVGIAGRIYDWDATEAAGRIAAACLGETVDADTDWWFARMDAALGLAEIAADGDISDKMASAGLKALVTGGATVAESVGGEAPEGATEAAATAGPADLILAGLAVAQGTPAQGEQMVLRATITNASGENVPAARVDFSYLAEGAEDWVPLGEDSTLISVPAGAQSEADAEAWIIPAGVTHVGAVVWREDVVETDEDNNALIAALEDLAAGDVTAAVLPATPATEEPAEAEAGAPAELAVAAMSVAQGTLATGGEVVLRATISNASAQAARDVRVDFSYSLAGGEDWAYLAEESTIIEVPAGGQADADAPSWVVPEGLDHIGVVVWRDGVAEQNEDDNALVVVAADLAAEGAVASAHPGGEAAGAGAAPRPPGNIADLLNQKKTEVAQTVIEMVGNYFLGELGGLLGTSIAPPGGGGAGGGAGGGVGAAGGAGAGAEGGGMPDLRVLSIAIDSGLLQAGHNVVLTANIDNTSPTINAPEVLVDFCYIAGDMPDWDFVTADSLVTSVAAGATAAVSTPAWPVPADILQLGVAVATPAGDDANPANDTMAVDASDLATEGAVASAEAEAGGAEPPEGPVVETESAGPETADLSVIALTVADGTLAEGTPVVLSATIRNSAAEAVNDANVDFSYFVEGGADWQYVSDEWVPVAVPAGGEAQAATQPWTVPPGLTDIGVVVWRGEGADPDEANNQMVATAEDLGGGTVVAEAEGGAGGGEGGSGGGGLVVVQKPALASAGSLLEYVVSAPGLREKTLRGVAYFKVDGKVMSQRRLDGVPGPGGDIVTFSWTPPDAGDHKIEVILPGAARMASLSQVKVLAGSSLDRLPGVLRTPQVEAAVMKQTAEGASSAADSAGRKLPGTQVTSAIRLAAIGAVRAPAAKPISPKPAPAASTTTKTTTTRPTLRLPTSTTPTKTTTTTSGRVPTGTAATKPTTTTSVRQPTISTSTTTPTTKTSTTTTTTGTTGTRKLPSSASLRFPTITRSPTTATSGKTATTTTGHATIATTPTTPTVTTGRATIAIGGSKAIGMVLLGPMSVKLPSDAVSSRNPTFIDYTVNKGGDPITAIQFVLKYDKRSVKVASLSLKGTVLEKLGWRLRTTERRGTGVLVSLSGKRALTGSGKLLSLVVSSATRTTASGKLDCTAAKINGKSVTIGISGGTVTAGR